MTTRNGYKPGNPFLDSRFAVCVRAFSGFMPIASKQTEPLDIQCDAVFLGMGQPCLFQRG